MRLVPALRCVLIVGLLSVGTFVNAQCPTAAGDETTYGTNAWIGYVYDGLNSFNSSNYQGTLPETTVFDESFCGSNCNFTANTGCPVNTETFSIRFKDEQDLACGLYTFMIGSDNGARFSINGGSSYLINVTSGSSYQVYSATVFLSGGTYDLVLDYFHNTGANEVSFDYTVVPDDYGGVISADQTICDTSINPASFTSVAGAVFCSGIKPMYQWEESTDAVIWSSISGATNAIYDVPSGLAAGTHYYRRSATDGTETEVSNTVTVVASVPQGDEISFGSGSWIGYAYSGANNFSATEYLGYFNEAATFDESFCGSACTFALNGCDLFTEDFTIRFKSQQTFACGAYDITIGGDDGVRLYVDGSLVINGYVTQSSYTTYTETVYLNGTHDLILEYFNVSGANRVSFSYVSSGSETAGVIAGSQNICTAAPIDPAPFTSTIPANFCTGSLSYQWEDSPDGSSWTPIGGATMETYNIPSGLAAGTYHYRRQASNGIDPAISSNVLTVIADSPQGDETTFGTEQWIGYVYDGANNFSSNYRGYYTEANEFDQSFVSNPFPIMGCDIDPESFSVRYKSTQNFACGAWNLTIGGDDGVRLFIDGNLAIDGFAIQPYTLYSKTVYLDGDHQLILEYYDQSSSNRVSFSKTQVGTGIGGTIGSDQTICDDPIDPLAFTNIESAMFCTGSISYQWQVSTNGGGSWSDVSGATSATYDIPSGLAVGSYLYRRSATNATDTYYSNEVSIVADSPVGDETTFGVEQWIGYVYGAENNFTTPYYQGYFTEPASFDESFCGNACTFPITGCDLYTEGFSVRFKSQQTFACGSYQLTIGGDDGVRLYVDGSLVIDGYGVQLYTTYTATVFLDGVHDLILEYFERSVGNRVSFNSVFLGPGDGGTIASDQIFCDPVADPDPFTSVQGATFCSGDPTPDYQWQESLDGLGWTNLAGATSETLDVAGLTTSKFYRRRAQNDDGDRVFSNIISVVVDPPQGDETTYGDNLWIGYVYDGRENYSSANYLGYFTEPSNFDESFCGSACTFPINGCDFLTETFTVRFRNQQTFACGSYVITIGGDDGIRLSLDGGSTYPLAAYGGLQPYTTVSDTFYLDGTYDLVLDYYDQSALNRVSYSSVFIAAGEAGTIGSGQEFCTAPFDPAAFTSLTLPTFCSGDAPAYQWQESSDGTSWLDIGGATSGTYDPPSGQAATRYYRRVETAGLTTLYSNTVTVLYDPPPVSDRFNYGIDSWIGHVYSNAPAAGPPVGEPDYSESLYLGYFTEPQQFDEHFCNPVASSCSFALTGCDLITANFSVEFRMTVTLPAGDYIFTLKSDDGSRLTMDDGVTYLIDYYTDHAYSGVGVSSASIPLAAGTYNFIIDYYDRCCDQRINFSYTSTPLPVTWYYFDGYYRNGSAYVEWRTASEINNTGFEVERSRNGRDFDTMGWVEGHGTTNEEQRYLFVDDAPQTGWNYYRLKQIDTDGQFEYSRLIPVYVDDVPQVEVFPNPFHDHLYLSRIQKDQETEVVLVNVLAQRSWTLQQDPIQPARFVLPTRLEPGFYSARIRIGKDVFIRKVMIE